MGSASSTHLPRWTRSPRHAKPRVHKSGAVLTFSPHLFRRCPGDAKPPNASHHGPENTGIPGDALRRRHRYLPRLPPPLQNPHHHPHPNQPQLLLLGPHRMDLRPPSRYAPDPRTLLPYASHLRRPPPLWHRIPYASPSPLLSNPLPTNPQPVQQALLHLSYTHTYHGWDIVYDSPSPAPQWVHLARERFYRGRTLTTADFDAVLGHCMAVTDAAASVFAADLIAAYPEAKVVLNTRADEEGWRRSLDKTLIRANRSWGFWVAGWLDRECFWAWHVYERFLWPVLFRCGDGDMKRAVGANAGWVRRGELFFCLSSFLFPGLSYFRLFPVWVVFNFGIVNLGCFQSGLFSVWDLSSLWWFRRPGGKGKGGCLCP